MFLFFAVVSYCSVSCHYSWSKYTKAK